jgi:hypothetical protein
MEVGTPLPPELAQIEARATLNDHSPEEMKAILAQLHRVHANYDDEIGQLHGKKVEVKRVLTKIYANRDMNTLAGFDNVLRMGPAKFSLSRAKDYLADAAAGLINLPEAAYQRLKRIVESGKDEE